MVRAIGRWVLPCLALFILGPVLTRLVSSLQSADGGPDVTLLVGAAPMLGLAFGVVSVIVCVAYGGIAARLLGERTGTLSGGLLLAWVAWGTGDMSMVLRFEGSAATLIRLAIEASVVCLITLGGAKMIMGLAFERGEKDGGEKAGRLFGSAASLSGLAAGAVAGILVAGVVAFDGLRGQALMAGVLGSIAAGAVSRLVALSMGEAKPSALMPFGAVALAAVISPLIGLVMPGGSGLGQAVISGTIPGLLLVQPLDWAAGMLLGAPIGVAWTASLAEKARESESAAAR